MSEIDERIVGVALKLFREALGANLKSNWPQGAGSPPKSGFVALREHNLAVGGESSGYIILLDHNTTGDGLLTGLQVLAIM